MLSSAELLVISHTQATLTADMVEKLIGEVKEEVHQYVG